MKFRGLVLVVACCVVGGAADAQRSGKKDAPMQPWQTAQLNRKMVIADRAARQVEGLRAQNNPHLSPGTVFADAELPEANSTEQFRSELRERYLGVYSATKPDWSSQPGHAERVLERTLPNNDDPPEPPGMPLGVQLTLSAMLVGIAAYLLRRT